ncbi:MAG: hypothetical protein KDJ38_11550, partial [Gammaproteobacteria bacterium]|nr:hypothetical protein [Gammaproteobacteria bacterium]
MSRLRLPLKTGTALLWLALAACATNKPAAPPETVVPEDGSGQIEPDTRRALPRHRWTRHSSPCLQVDTV